ncbi:bifunctional protein-serine/threonine kinase/phosphatase [Vibrio ostreae]|uniref:Bifunctional protein-serine/threonine kinase/phosphatase n=1 Tax=Vibrio ostreae TaxID=2841925 RepID=A0A975U6W6_9VIBR|nr:bifunctional protein-serine/threonine kinase/phosphatase [Vibrio ostreae]QXO16303.1 bifunctional protein-serine/threonine kinase/phosphatase [Vibrio ostreae]
MHARQMKQGQALMIDHAGTSLTGTRQHNQDALLVKQPRAADVVAHKGIVACIADGVSCSDQSQKASHTAVVQFINDYYATPDSWSIRHSAGQILTALNSSLYEEGCQQNLTHNGLVTTFSAAIFKSNTAHLFHVGDTRIYRVRDGKLRLLTRDHQRTQFGQQAYLTRALGMDNRLDVDYQTVTLKPDDYFILTSDGVHDFVDETRMLDALNQESGLDLQALSEALCQQALDNGSQDNVSCLLLKVRQLPQRTLLEHQVMTLTRVIPPALEVGQSLDGYRVDEVLYAGSRSHVYRVTEVASGESRVLKAPSLQYSDDRDYLVHFANEFWVGSQINSERVMKVYPTPADSPFIYQLCEWVQGITLRQWMFDNPAPSLARVRTILSEVVKAVRVFQRADMVHRDLKPENIMLTSDGKVKIIDFGAVKVMGLEEMQAVPEPQAPLGAVNYIAPEYINGSEVTVLSDLFSIAVIAYEMLSGQLPYKARQSTHLQSARHIKWDYRPIEQFRSDIPLWVDLALHKATHPSPAQRYQALGDFILDLFTPNIRLQKEFKHKPVLQRNPQLFWKATALLAIAVALLEGVMLL